MKQKIYIMKRILRFFKYKIHDETGNVNKKANDWDYFLCWLYAIISLYNAISGIGTMKLFAEFDLSRGIEGIVASPNFNSVVKTILLLVINLIILIRLNIKCYIKKCESKENALMNYNNDDSIRGVLEIITQTWDRRIQLLKYIYLMDVVIIVMNFYFRASVETSLAWLVILPIFVTLLNNLLDIAENKYSAEPGVLFSVDKDIIEKIIKESE